MRRLGLAERHEVHAYTAVYAKPREGALPPPLQRYDAQRYTLFSRFDEGIQLDEEMWYSVTPEPIAHVQALRVACRTSGSGGVLIDGFCGVGGNSIQLGLHASPACSLFILGIDTSPQRLRTAKQHADIYGVGGRLDFVIADFRSASRLLRPSMVSGVFVSPPWADEGNVPSDHGDFTVRRLAQGLDGAAVMKTALALSRDVALFLPRATLRREVRALAVLARSDVAVQEHVRTVNGYTARHATAITCYFGAWAMPRAGLGTASTGERFGLRPSPVLEHVTT